MVLSLLARRITFGKVAVRVARPATLSVVTRRTLFATPRFNLPPTEASQETAEKKSTRKTGEKKVTKAKGGIPAKRGRPPKKPEERKTKPKPEKQRLRVPKHLKPPKRAPGPYLLFYSSFLKSQPQGTAIQDYRELSRRAAETWNGYSIAEKQPFYDENEARKAQAKQERDEFFSKTSISDLKQLNAIRKAQGKNKYRSTRKSTIPITPFLSFLNEFRNSLEGQAIINETSPEKTYVVRSVVAAANRWKSMSPEEKAPYHERYRKEKEELKVEHTDS